MTELFEKLYPIACECGVDAVFYWDMTYEEITAAISAYNKQQETSMRIQSIIAYRQADQIASLVGIMIGNKQEAPAIYEAFPGVFPELERKAEMEKAQQQHWQIMKSRIEAYATEKRKRGERRGNDSGGTPDTDNL
ncbi:hypothetical protein [Sporosarcina sp. NPDC096371]|uniref:hypothetical protein n=1 Tax=Sporosarcina sp. NPDC096371 TaxID=3364530 RepID=UPI00381E017F